MQLLKLGLLLLSSAALASAACSGTDLALGASATASSAPCGEGCAASNAVDGAAGSPFTVAHSGVAKNGGGEKYRYTPGCAGAEQPCASYLWPVGYTALVRAGSRLEIAISGAAAQRSDLFVLEFSDEHITPDVQRKCRTASNLRLFVAPPPKDRASRPACRQDEWPGLAHFCEHMLFLGTEKYPREDEHTSAHPFHNLSHPLTPSLALAIFGRYPRED